MRDSYQGLELEGVLDPDDPDVRGKPYSKFKHGKVSTQGCISIEFWPVDYRERELVDGERMITHTNVDLSGFAVCDKPAYKQSMLREEQTEESTGMEDKDRAEIRAMVDEILAKREDPAPDLSGIPAMMDEAMKRFAAEQLPESINATIAKREEEAAEKAAEAERMGDMDGKKKKKPMDMAKDDDMGRRRQRQDAQGHGRTV